MNNNPIQQAHQARVNIESLQLPPNPVGPYMRQNREQLLAKQQILEQFARQQKQMQKQQQQQQPSIAFPPSHPKSSGSLSNPSSSSSRSSLSDRSIAPPGLGGSKFDGMSGGDRAYYQRSMSQHNPRPHSTQGYPGGGGFGGFGGLQQQQHQQHQTRSISDIRMENKAGFPSSQQQDHYPSDRFPQYRDQFNQLQQDTFSPRY